MKKFWLVFVLSAISAILSAATGERSDDYLVLMVPLAFVILVLAIYRIKQWIKKRKEEQLHHETPADSSLHVGH